MQSREYGDQTRKQAVAANVRSGDDDDHEDLGQGCHCPHCPPQLLFDFNYLLMYP